jgi:Protein of unknown function (DUF1569)
LYWLDSFWSDHEFKEVNMADPIDTTKVTGRRQLQFDSLQDIVADVEQLAKAREIRSLGNWSPGQVLKHLTIVMNGSIDGNLAKMPGIIRFIMSLGFKKKFLNKPMSAGFQLPARGAALLPPPTTWEEGLQGFRDAARRLQTENKRESHPVLGRLTTEEWEQLHCRHSALHLSFLVPA